MAGTVIADKLEAASTSTLVLKNGVASTPPTVQDSAGTQIGTFCRAWVNFNGTGVVAIRADFNVTDILDNGTGDYTVNFTTVMPDANYSAVMCAKSFGINNGTAIDIKSTAAGSCNMRSLNVSGAGGFDSDIFTVAVFR